MTKIGRPIANNVDYFPHKCKDDKVLTLIQHKYKSEGYEVFYRLQQHLGDAEYHKIDLKNDFEKEMFEMGMSVRQEVVYGVIDILVGMNWLDKELYEKDNVLWSDNFVNSIRVVYINRKRPVPTKQDIYRDSTSRNKSIVEYSKEKNSIEEHSREKNSEELEIKEREVWDKTPFLYEEYQKLYPGEDISFLKKYLTLNRATNDGAIRRCEKKLNNNPIIFDKAKGGCFKAWCSKCGNRLLPKGEWELKKGSECCGTEYINHPKND